MISISRPNNQIIDRETVRALLGECSDELYDYIQAGVELDTTIGYDSDGFYLVEDWRNLPQGGNPPVLRVMLKEIDLKPYKGVRCISIPINLLCEPIQGHWVYRIAFSPVTDAAEQTLRHPSFSAFRVGKGYIGMTSREKPTDRFNEHIYKVNSGGGHLLHKAWRAIMAEIDVMVVFHIVASIPSRDSAFEIEERLVDQIGTIAPHGLNVIAGGMKGIREMWRLGLMEKKGNPTEAQKDTALELLESKRSPVAAHYRTGHIRKLPVKCKLETTWVSPCWVGLKEVSA